MTSHKNKKSKDIKKNKDIKNTVDILTPMWCSNMYHNEKYVNDKTNFSNLLCSTFPMCYRLNELKKIYYSDKTYSMKKAISLTELPKSIILNAFKYCNENYQSYIGSEICITCKNRLYTRKPALIIGGGPSLETYKHLELLQKNSFNGDIFCVSSVLKNVLEHGVIPKYFASLDADIYDVEFIDYEIVRENNDKMIGLFATIVKPETNEVFKGTKYYYNPYLSEESGQNMNYIFTLMTRCPSINTGGNVGSTLLMLAVALGYNPIIMIGYDMSFTTFEEMKKYYEHDLHPWNPNPQEINWNEAIYEIMFNPETKKEYYVNPVFNAYKENTLLLLNALKKMGIKSINCTEQGAIHGKDVLSIGFDEYLKNQDKYNVI